MNTAFDFFRSDSLNVLGYTLLHSIWQALLISIVVAITLRAIPTKFSNVRYVIGSAGLLSMVLVSLATFIYLRAGSTESGMIAPGSGDIRYTPDASADTPTVFVAYISTAQTFIQSAIPLFIMIWIAGALLFSLRIFIGLAYVERLRLESRLVENEWSDYIQKVAGQLKIQRLVLLAESASIEAPMVVGYLKPLILIPIGMCSGLSTAQLETIFLHELMHIRRRDYLINLIQSFVEAIYFFNPFVWIISETVKREREHCCDDAVVQLHGNAVEYVRALATLEEVRLSRTGLSLSLAGNKNELLNRIKRLMEKSVKNHYSRERIIPALLLVIGLICASWITTNTGRKEPGNDTYKETLVQDTTKKDNKKIKRAKKPEAGQREASAARENTGNNDVHAEENVVEENVEHDFDFKYSHEPVPLPDFDIDFPQVPDFAGIVPPLPEFDFQLKDFASPRFDWDDNDWEKFSQEFEEKFKSRFGDFYEKNEEGIQKMMEEIQQNFHGKFGEDWQQKMQDFAEKHEDWARKHAEKMALQGEHLGRLSEDLHRLEGFQEEFEKKHKEFERRHQEFEERSRSFENALKDELIKDGYLEKDEPLENIHWHNGTLKINGETVKPADEKKYNEIRKKYFSGPKEFKRVE